MYLGCGSTAYSVETVLEEEGNLYSPDARPGLLATTLPRLTGGRSDDLSICRSVDRSPHRRRPARPGGALLRITADCGLFATSITSIVATFILPAIVFAK